MIRMFVRHAVFDYAGWRRVYDDFDSKRRDLGVTAEAVYRSPMFPNDVTITHDFESLDKAMAFSNSDELREAMGHAHVASQPLIWFTEPA